MCQHVLIHFGRCGTNGRTHESRSDGFGLLFFDVLLASMLTRWACRFSSLFITNVTQNLFIIISQRVCVDITHKHVVARGVPTRSGMDSSAAAHMPL